MDYAIQRMETLGYSDRVNIVFCDYRNISNTFPRQSFDAVISIEMLEAVGHENLSTYFSIVNQMLKPGAAAVIQVIGIPDERYEEYMSGSDFIRRHIFPGGHLPCLAALKQAIENTDLALEEDFDIGPDYACSLMEWRLRFVDQIPKLLEMGFDEVFIRKWIFYFAYCEVGFRRKYIHDWQIVFRKSEASASAVLVPNKARYLGSNVFSIDFITGAFFGAWFVLCAFAVMEKGRHLLVIPAVLTVFFLLHYLLYSVRGTEKYRYEQGAFVSSAFGVLVSLLGIFGIIDDELAVLTGTGLCAADLFALVWSGFFSPRLVRVLFHAIELSVLGVASFHGKQTLPMFHSTILLHLLSSNTLHLAIHGNVLRENSQLILAMLPVSLISTVLVHVHGIFYCFDSLLTLGFSSTALIYDFIVLLSVIGIIKKKKLE